MTASDNRAANGSRRSAEIEAVERLRQERRRSRMGIRQSDWLSQEEVDALLAGIAEDDPPIQREPGAAQPYDLGRSDRIVRGRLPILELIFERFAVNLLRGWFRAFRRSAEISVGPVRVAKHSDFVRNLAVPTNLNLVRLTGDLDGRGMVVFDPNLVFLTVDHLFGSDGRFHTRGEGRDFSPVETIVIDRMLDLACGAFEEACAPHLRWGMALERRETNPRFASLQPPGSTALWTTLTVEMSGNSAELHLCFPMDALDPVLGILRSAHGSEHPLPGPGIDATEARALVRACASVPGASAASVAAWRPGQILPLPDEAELFAGPARPAFSPTFGPRSAVGRARIEGPRSVVVSVAPRDLPGIPLPKLPGAAP